MKQKKKKKVTKKKIKFLIIHCSATIEGKHYSPETIQGWHRDEPPQGRGWSRVGYSDLILLDGTRHKFVEHNNDEFIDNEEITFGAKGVNSISRHLCYIGGVDEDIKPKDTRTDRQTCTMISIIDEVLNYAPDILVAGHNQFSSKACPSFSVPAFCRSNGIEEKNIYQENPYNYKL